MGTLIKTRFTPAIPVTPRALAPKPPPAYADGVAKEKVRLAPRQRGSGLRACPFCRELFTDDETDTCPECGLTVKDLASLPPSPDADALLAEEHGSRPLEHTIPQAENLPWTDLSRGRGILALVALAGMVAFYLPWAIQTMPESVRYTGAELAKSRGLFWMTFTSWLVLIPAVLSRRTIVKMVGARAACVLLAVAPAIQCGFLLTRPTRIIVKGLPFEYHWGLGFYATLALSLVATFFAFRFGGRLDDVKVRRGSSKGEVLH